MKVLFYSIKDFEQSYIENGNHRRHSLAMTGERLSESTAHLAKDCDAICIFTADDASAAVLHLLAQAGVRYIAIRAAGHDNVDLDAARKLKIRVANVPSYSPHAIAEHAVSMMLAMNRKTVLANEQVKQYDFTLGHLIGFNMRGKTVGIIGTGQTGAAAAAILHGFGCRLLGYDANPNSDLSRDFGLQYTDLATLCSEADIITLHCCLNGQTRHMINRDVIATMKKGVMLVNTARGAVVNAKDVADALETGQIGYFGMDVYEYEQDIFFKDLRLAQPADKLLARLMNMPNVLITPHQGFATREALGVIADVTFHTLGCWETKQASRYELSEDPISAGAHSRL